MGGVGTAIGGLLTITSIFLAIVVTISWTTGYFWLISFWIFGLLGGLALGNLNSRKARTRNTYKQEYLAYASIFLGAIILLGIAFLLGLLGNIDGVRQADAPSASVIVWIAIASGLTAYLGIGLVVANIVAPESSF